MFKRIPGFERYVINDKGLIKYAESGKVIIGTSGDGYRQVRIYSDIAKDFKTMQVHRLVMMTFKPVPNMDNLVVNHLDFNRRNNSIDNLEWCTVTENNHHAGRARESESCKPVLVKDCISGEIKYFNSVNETAKHEHVSVDTIAWRLSQQFGRVFWNCKQYKLFHDKREFPDVDLERLKTISLKYTNTKPVLVYYLLTNEEKTFDCLTELTYEFNVSPATVSGWDKEGQTIIYPQMILIKYIWDDTPWREIKDPYLEVDTNNHISGRSASRIVATVNRDKDVKIFLTAAECARYYNIRPNLLDYRLKSKRIYNGIQFLYYLEYHQMYGPLELRNSNERPLITGTP